MCFSSSPLITTSHTLLPGPPQRKLNAAPSVWYPTPSKFVHFHCCWDAVVVFKHLASEEQLKSSYFLCVFLLFFSSPVFLLAQLSFCFLSVLQNVHFQKTETRAEKYCVTYILFNYVKICITKGASKHLTNYTTRLQYIFFFFFFFLLGANT